MSNQQHSNITVITDCSVYDAYCEGPKFVAITLNKNDINMIKSYRESIQDMINKGLKPNQISSFSYNVEFVSPDESQPLNKKEADSLRFLNESTEDNWYEGFLCKLEPNEEYSTISTLNGKYTVDATSIKITSDSISYNGYMNDEIEVESSVLREEEFSKIVKWIEELS